MNDLLARDMFGMEPAESFFRNWAMPWRGEVAQNSPRIKLDLSEHDGQYQLKAEIPGVKKEDIDIRIDGNQVTIIAEVKKESEEKRDGRLLRCERQYGYASRTFSLDCEVDEAKTAARYHDGILELTLPKKSPSETRKIAIS